MSSFNLHSRLFSSSPPHSTTAAATTAATTILLLSILIATTTCQGQDDDQFHICGQSQLYVCGRLIHSISYPFWGTGRPDYCGHPDFELKCQKGPQGEYPIIEIKDRSFLVLGINQTSRLLSIARLDLSENFCTDQNPSNITLDSDPFGYSKDVRELYIFYGCSGEITREYNFTCGGRNGFYADEAFLRTPQHSGDSCDVGIEVPVLRVALDGLLDRSLSLQDGLRHGFQVVYDAEDTACSRCHGSGGVCGSDPNGREFLCICHGHTDPRVCKSRGDRLNVGRKLGIGFGAAGATLIIMGLVIFIHVRRNKRHYSSSSWVSRGISSYPSSMSDLEKSSTYHGVQIFNYNELEKATNNFDSKNELGDGGYGTVYKGKLKDGRIVAVKRLYEHNYRRVEQFMNEVEILTRLRHQNLVSLYGFTSRHCRELLLVYEYVPNGTVADHLYGERAKSGPLSWATRMSIAVETASALVYLHASDIIHRDVKTHNILLDNNFSVKVADFGLSRLFPTDVTHVSTGPQGTPGYVDPEYHECYQLTNKSDVYSFGVVLVELISTKPAVDITRHRHEINLSNMAINKIQSHALHELVDPCLGFESDSKVRRMISDVAELAFQCLQNERGMRPSTVEVLEVLKGIQGQDRDAKIAEELDIPKDEVVLLKNDHPPTLSPDSVTTNWISRGTTPNVSS